MANVTRKVNFRFILIRFVIEYAPSQTPERMDTRTASGRKVTQATVGVISVSPQPQECDGNWTVVLSWKTKARNLKNRRANSSLPRAERPITRNAARRNPELSPPAIYPERTIPQFASHNFLALVAPRTKWMEAQNGKMLMIGSPTPVSPQTSSPITMTPRSIGNTGSAQKSNETPISPLFISPVTSIYSRLTPTTASTYSKGATLYMAETSQENRQTTKDRVNQMAEAQRALMDECRNLREALATLAHNVAQLAPPPMMGATNGLESQPEGSRPQGVGSRGSVLATRAITQEAVRIERERANTGCFRYRTPYSREVEDVPFPANFKHPDF